MIFWPSRSLYSNSSRIWNNLPHSKILLGKERTLRDLRNDLRNSIHWVFRIYRMSTPHIYGRNGRRYPSLLYGSNNNYCHSDRSESIQMTCNTKRVPYFLWHSHTMILRVCISIYSWGINRGNSSQFFNWHCATRHILRCSPLSLRPFYRSCVCSNGWSHPLTPTIVQYLHETKNTKDPILQNVYWSKHNILSSTFPWIEWDTSTILRLPRYLHLLKRNLIIRIPNLIPISSIIRMDHLRSPLIFPRMIIFHKYQFKNRMNKHDPCIWTYLQPTNPNL